MRGRTEAKSPFVRCEIKQLVAGAAAGARRRHEEGRP